jgi:Cd2+/Zn2+-exporting ATPase
MKHDDDQAPGPHDGHAHAPAVDALVAACGACSGNASSAALLIDGPLSAGVRYRVPAMDCASEESEIRRAVEGIAGIRALTFRLRLR